jgi:hypothetical protein
MVSRNYKARITAKQALIKFIEIRDNIQTLQDINSPYSSLGGRRKTRQRKTRRQRMKTKRITTPMTTVLFMLYNSF